jgi:type II secretory pathway pseudopilin PulG
MIPSSAMKNRRRLQGGFSLVEVVIALGIITFTLVALIGLLAGGLQSGRESVEDVQAAHITSTILGQRRAAPVLDEPSFILPRLNDPTLCPPLDTIPDPYRGVAYLTQEGDVPATDAERYYRLDYTLSRNKNEVVERTQVLARVHLSLTTPWTAIPSDIQAPTSTSPKVRTRFETLTYIPVPQPAP